MRVKQRGDHALRPNVPVRRCSRTRRPCRLRWKRRGRPRRRLRRRPRRRRCGIDHGTRNDLLRSKLPSPSRFSYTRSRHPDRCGQNVDVPSPSTSAAKTTELRPRGEITCCGPNVPHHPVLVPGDLVVARRPKGIVVAVPSSPPRRPTRPKAPPSRSPSAPENARCGGSCGSRTRRSCRRHSSGDDVEVAVAVQVTATTDSRGDVRGNDTSRPAEPFRRCSVPATRPSRRDGQYVRSPSPSMSSA